MLFSNVLIKQREKRNLQKVIRNIIIIYSSEYKLYYCVIFLCILCIFDYIF